MTATVGTAATALTVYTVASKALAAAKLAMASSVGIADTATKGFFATLAMSPIGLVTIALSSLVGIATTAAIVMGENAESTEELRNAYADTKNTLSSLDTELQNTQARLKELYQLQENGTLSVIEQQEIKDLTEYNDQLERSISINKTLLEERQRRLANSVSNDLNDLLSTDNPSYFQNSITGGIYRDYEEAASAGGSFNSTSVRGAGIPTQQVFDFAINNWEKYGDSIDDVRLQLSELNSLQLEGLPLTESQQNQLEFLSGLEEDYIFLTNLYETLNTELEGFNKIEIPINPAEVNINNLLDMREEIGKALINGKEFSTVLNDINNEELKVVDTTKELTSDVKSFTSELKSVENGVKDLNGYIADLNSGGKLSVEAIINLIDNYGVLESQIIKTSDGYTVEIGVLEELKKVQIENAIIARNVQLEQTKVIESGLLDRLQYYDEEIKQIKSIGDTEIALAKIRAVLQSQSINSASDVQERERIKGLISELENLQNAFSASDTFAKDFYGSLGLEPKNSGSSAKPETINYNSLFDWENRENELSYNLGQKTSEEYWNGYQETWEKFKTQYGNESREWIEFDRQLIAIHKGLMQVADEETKRREDEAQRRQEIIQKQLDNVEKQRQAKVEELENINTQIESEYESLINPLQEQLDLMDEAEKTEGRKLKLLEAEKRLNEEIAKAEKNKSQLTRVVLGANGMQRYVAEPDNNNSDGVANAKVNYDNILKDINDETNRESIIDKIQSYEDERDYKIDTNDTAINNLKNFTPINSETISKLMGIIPTWFKEGLPSIPSIYGVNRFGLGVGEMYQNLNTSNLNTNNDNGVTFGNFYFTINEADDGSSLAKKIATELPLLTEQALYSNKNRK